MSFPVKVVGFREEVFSVLQKKRWQVASMVAVQITWPPEALQRENLNRVARGEPVMTIEAIKCSFTSRLLASLAKKGLCSRRDVLKVSPNSKAKYEYRLNSDKNPVDARSRGWKQVAVWDALAAGEDPYAIEGISHLTVKDYVCRFKKKFNCPK
jgi:hypothetical protein